MNLLTLTPAEFCESTEACAEGRGFALRYDTMADVWENCPKSEWLLWIADKLDQRPDNRTLRLFEAWCARNTPLADGRVTGDLLTDQRSIVALEVAEPYANRMATTEELAAVSTVARDAACAAAEAAISAVARGVAWASARAAAWAIALDVARKAQAAQLRRMVPNPFPAKEGQL